MTFDQDVAVISLSILTLTLLVFYIHAYIVSDEEFTLKGFTIADQTLDKNRFANTFAAGTISLSTVFAFMLATVNVYGVWLFFAPLTMFAGTTLLAYSLEKYNINISGDYTQASFVLDIYESKPLTLLITSITVVSFIGTVLLEIYFGTILIGIFLPDGEPYKFLSFSILAILVLGYLRMGGYRVVVITDTWQMYLIGVSVSLLLGLSVFVSGPEVLSLTSLDIFGNSGFWSIFVFCAWISTLNIFQPFGRLSTWQRFAALSENESPSIVTWKSWKKFFLVWGLPIIAFLILMNKGYNITSLPDFFEFFSRSSEILQMTFFPVVYAGLVAMLLSTIDTRLIAALTSVADNATFGAKLEELERENPDTLKRIATTSTAVVFILLGFLYFSTKVDFFNLLTTLINVIFNGLTVFAPIVGFGMYSRGKNGIPTKNVSGGKTWILVVGLAISYLTILTLSIYGFHVGNDTIGQLSLFVSLAIMSGFVLLFSKTVPVRQ